MGFADIAAQVVLIFIFIIIFTTLFTQYQTSAVERAEYNQFLYDDLTNKIQTDVEIVYVNKQGAGNNLIIVNTGSTTLDPNLIDVFYNGEKIPRSDLTLTLYNQTNDPQLFNPTESLNISFSQSGSGRILYQVSTQYGISAYRQVESWSVSIDLKLKL